MAFVKSYFYNEISETRFVGACVAVVCPNGHECTRQVCSARYGRKVRLWVSDEQVLSLSAQEYQSYLKTAKISTNAANTAMVRKVGKRLATAVETYLRHNNRLDAIHNYSWEFNLVQDNSANAFCMPGGKIVVYEGLLPVTQSEDALAIVLGHEIAHAVAKHSAEQLSTQVKQQAGAKLLGAVLGATGVSNTTSLLTQTAFSLGSKLGSLKYSRDNESEADYMGLILPLWRVTTPVWPSAFGSVWQAALLTAVWLFE